SALSVPKSLINPLVDSFSDLVIPLEDLRVPGRQEHENKTFKRCNFVGPSTLAISGGNLNNVALNMCGDIVALKEGVYLT
ncbi:hypothetical protein, partial [Pseudomonas poae]|uniref:hypothetical protein n=1 Tax=Pseudomonas poae TaxID=200451 RepID=UPI0034D4B87B